MISCFKGGNSNSWANEMKPQTESYINNSDLCQDVPKISKIIESLKQYNVLKYGAYRTAFKLRVLQKASKLHLVDLPMIDGIIREFQLTDNGVDEVLTPEKAERILLSLYTETGNKRGLTEEPNIMAKLLLTFLHAVFGEHAKPLLLVQMKVVLCLFSAANLGEKYKYLFYNFSTRSVMDKSRLQLLLEIIAKLPEIVGEQITFGSHLAPVAVRNCIKFCKGKITEKKFRNWLSLQPQTLVWISVLHRISVSEKTQHFVVCDNCKANPVIGMRYRCLYCIHYNLCQNCFLQGHVNKRHKQSHPVHEYCQPPSIWEETKTIMHAVKNKLPFARCQVRPYLSFEDDDSIYASTRSNSKISGVKPHNTSSCGVISEISSIVNKLEADKKEINKIFQELDLGHENGDSGITNSDAIPHNKKESLQALHKNFEDHLQILKALLTELKDADISKISAENVKNFVSPVPFVNGMDQWNYFESTPLTSGPDQIQPHRINTETFSRNPNDSENCIETLRANTSSLELSNIFTSSRESLLTDTEESEFENQAANISLYTAVDSPYAKYSAANNTSLDVSRILDDTRHSKEAVSELSQHLTTSDYNSSNLVNDSEEKQGTKSCHNESTPARNPVKFPVLKKGNFSYSLDKDTSLEMMEIELQAILEHLEQLVPQISNLSLALSDGSSMVKEKVSSTLADMETTVKKLSHVSLGTSTGSTDL